ncbi:MAG TPA: AAA family ATPase [Streptosporangiaceae bacterium]|nr:AAA family ATPase [Streptosporangiaceae bacterium]
MSTRLCHGFVVGKFYPPHRGHQYLIEQAAARSAQVTVLVMAAACETVPLMDRVAWLRAVCGGLPTVTVTGVRCDVPVDFGDEAVWRAQVAVMSAAMAANGRPPVDAVFSSEPYGHELAARLGAEHVSIDPGRLTHPVSASQIRADLAGCWDQLAVPAQAGLAARVVVVGAESTGTSTIAGLLAGHYRCRGGAWARTCCVSEAGRDYTVTKWREARAAAAAAAQPEPPLAELVWTAADFDAVAAEQTRREDQAATAGSPLVVCDTDAFATSVWERRYLGGQARGPQPWATAGLPHHDVYLVTSHVGVPWHDDGLREGDLAVRAAMTGWFTEALTAAGHSWVLLTGSIEDRLTLAVRVTDSALRWRAAFGPAVTDGVAEEAAI